MAVVIRPDIDIDADLQQIIKNYPPLNNDRHHVTVSVNHGEVSVAGHIKAPMTRRVLASRFRNVAGVRSVNTDALYDDETIRLAAGKLIPAGALVTSDYGTVVLAGTLDADTSAKVIRQLEHIPGVKHVINAVKA